MNRILLAALLAFLCAAPLRAQSTPAPQTPATAAAPTPQFFIKLIPPRPTFAQDATPHELEVMQAHAAYWTDLFKTGKVLILGPVMDPKGVWGMFVVECPTQAEAEHMIANDPSVKAGINRYEVAPMQVFLRK